MLGRAVRSTIWVAIALLCAAPVCATAASPLPLSLTLALAALAAVALWSSMNALLVLAGLGPLAAAIRFLTGASHDGGALLELAVLVVCGGAALRAAIRSRPLAPTAFDRAAIAFICVVVASSVAQLPVVLLREGEPESMPAIWRLLVRAHFDRALSFAAVWQAALLVEGVALAALVARVLRREDGRRLADIAIAGAAACAALNVCRLLEVSVAHPPVGETLRRTLVNVRFNTQFGDLNAAGSYFAMIAVLCVAGAGWSTWRGRLYSSLGALTVFALWVSGSRVAMAAAVVTSAGLLALRSAGPLIRRSRRRILVGAATALFATFAAIVLLFPVTRHSSFGYSATTRFELLKMGARMTADGPLFGVGIAQFYALFPRYVSHELQQAFIEMLGTPITHENAHNQFVQVLAELGIPGLAAFLAVLGLAMRPGGDSAPGWRPGVVGALAAFLLTSLAGHPLLTPVVSYSFWMMTGLAASAAPSIPRGALTKLGWGAAAVALLLLVAAPFRWASERREADLTDVSLGFSPWQRDDGGLRYRWAGDRATLFVPSTAALAKLPLQSPDEAGRKVAILLDGRPAGVVLVGPGAWREAMVPLPSSKEAPAFRRLDLRVALADSSPVRDRARALMVGRSVELPRR